MKRPTDQTPARRDPPRRGRVEPKGRQVAPAALDSIAALLGGQTPRRDLLIEYLHAIQDRHGEISAVIRGEVDAHDNPLKHAPHPVEAVCGNAWPHAYSREQAAFPLPYLRRHKFWPAVARIDNVHGDRNLVCTCDSVEI